jgi:hypothetical protein
MEMRNRHINAARNVWDRAVTLMPRIEQFWFKYVYTEEMVGNLQGSRVIFDRWMDWEPDDHAWTSSGPPLPQPPLHAPLRTSPHPLPPPPPLSAPLFFTALHTTLS